MSFFDKLKDGLKRTKENMVLAIEEVFDTYTKVDDAFLEELEEILIMSDVSMNTAIKISEELKETVKRQHMDNADEVRQEVKRITAQILDKGENAHRLPPSCPQIILVIGVNGVGKTTSIAKIANGLKQQGKSVLLVAADTFRAAAAEQLVVWGERIGINVVRHKEGSDPAAVIFDGIQSAKAKGTDVVICDTAGRLHNKKNLMNELEKMNKIIDREFEDAVKETLLVIDGATGQNAKSQVKEFSEITEITGIILTKLDGTAKGGIVISIADEFDIPVKYIGVGEGIEDMQPFMPLEFVDALFGSDETQRVTLAEEEQDLTQQEEPEPELETEQEETEMEPELETEQEEAEPELKIEAEPELKIEQEETEMEPELETEQEEAEPNDEASSDKTAAHESNAETAAENQTASENKENEQESADQEENKGFWSKLFRRNK